MISGCRWDLPGAQTFYNVEPDLSCFGKGIGNGFSLSALVGRREIMDQGGIHQTERPKVFLLSATHGGETHAIAAAMATLREFQEAPVVDHLWQIGRLLQDGINSAAAAHGLSANVRCDHYPCSPALSFFDGEGKPSAPLRTLFLQEMVAHGVLIPYIAPSFSHTETQVAQTADAAYEALAICRRAMEIGFDGYLHSAVVKPVFRKYN